MENHIQILIGRNEPMKCFELAVQIGGFATKKDAQIVADAIRRFLEAQGQAQIERVQ